MVHVSQNYLPCWYKVQYEQALGCGVAVAQAQHRAKHKEQGHQLLMSSWVNYMVSAIYSYYPGKLASHVFFCLVTIDT